MRSLRPAVTAALLLAVALLPARARGQDESAVRKGRLIVGGAASFSSTHDDVTGRTTSSLALQPAALIFVHRRLAIGGAFSWTSSGSRGRSSWSAGIGPAVRWFVPSGARRVLPFLGASVIPSRAHSEADSPVPGGGTIESDHRALLIDGSLGLLGMLGTHVGLTGEAFYSRTEDQVHGALAAASALTTVAFGVRFGVVAFAR